MSNKEKSLFDAFVRQGLGAARAFRSRSQAWPGCGRDGFAAERDAEPGARRRLRLDGQKGQTLRLLLNNILRGCHAAEPQAFEEMTGLKVTYDIFPEDVYFDKVTAALSSKSTQYDVFMTRRLPDLAVRPGWLAGRSERIHQGSEQDGVRITIGKHPAEPAQFDCVERQAWRAARHRPMRSSGRCPGASRSTTSATTSRFSTLRRSIRRKTCPI